MTQLDTSVYRKLELVSNKIKRQLQSKGIAIPVKNDDGTITLGNYTILKKNGFYSIVDHSNEIIVDKINLPQSAAILANSLAVGKFLDDNILRYDRKYGYAEFEEQLHYRSAERALKTNIDRADVLFTKSKINYYKKQEAKREILKSFEKLRNFA